MKRILSLVLLSWLVLSTLTVGFCSSTASFSRAYLEEDAEIYSVEEVEDTLIFYLRDSRDIRYVVFLDAKTYQHKQTIDIRRVLGVDTELCGASLYYIHANASGEIFLYAVSQEKSYVVLLKNGAVANKLAVSKAVSIQDRFAVWFTEENKTISVWNGASREDFAFDSAKYGVPSSLAVERIANDGASTLRVYALVSETGTVYRSTQSSSTGAPVAWERVYQSSENPRLIENEPFPACRMQGKLLAKNGIYLFSQERKDAVSDEVQLKWICVSDPSKKIVVLDRNIDLGLNEVSLQKDGSYVLNMSRMKPSLGYQYIVTGETVSRREIYSFGDGYNDELKQAYAAGKAYIGWEYKDSNGNLWIYFDESFNREALAVLKTADGRLHHLYPHPEYPKSKSPSSPDIYIDGKLLEYRDARSFVKDETTYIPVRVIVESLGGSVSWNQSDQSVSIVYQGQTKTFRDEVVYRSNRAFLPLRKLFESLDLFVSWIGKYGVIDAYR